MNSTTKKTSVHVMRLEVGPAHPLDLPHARAVSVRKKEEADEATRNAHEYRVLNSEREGSPLSEIPMSAVAAYALGAGFPDEDVVDIVDGMLEEIAVGIRVLRAAVRGDITFASDSDFDSAMHMLERRAEVARELARRRGVAPKPSVEELITAGVTS